MILIGVRSIAVSDSGSWTLTYVIVAPILSCHLVKNKQKREGGKDEHDLPFHFQFLELLNDYNQVEVSSFLGFPEIYLPGTWVVLVLFGFVLP